MDNNVPYKEVEYGFEYGAATVERLISDAKTGTVVIGIETRKLQIEVRVTRTGKIRVFRHGGGEWLEGR